MRYGLAILLSFAFACLISCTEDDTAFGRQEVSPIAEPVAEYRERLPKEEQPSPQTMSQEQLRGWREFHRALARKDQQQPRQTESYLDDALLLLRHGCFDSAITVLEQAQQAAGAGDPASLPPGQPRAGLFRWSRSLPPQQRAAAQSGRQLAPVVDQMLEDARQVKQTLTKARDALREHGIDATYPDPLIFTEALKLAPREDAFLFLNLMDAWTAAHPDARFAHIAAAELNLGYVELVNKTSDDVFDDVPFPRHDGTFFRAQEALEQCQRLDPNDPFPALRQTQHILARIESGTNDGRTKRIENFEPMLAAWRALPDTPHFTDEQKAYLSYGRAMFYLQLGSWGNPEMIDSLIGWLRDAARFAPDNPVYAGTLAFIEQNRDAINNAMLRAHANERERSMRMAQEAFGGQDYGRPPGNIYYDLLWVIFELGMDKDHFGTNLTDAFKEFIGCPACWGTGGMPILGEPCPMCFGQGRR